MTITATELTALTNRAAAHAEVNRRVRRQIRRDNFALHMHTVALVVLTPIMVALAIAPYVLIGLGVLTAIDVMWGLWS